MKKWKVKIPEETETGKNVKCLIFVIEIAQRSEQEQEPRVKSMGSKRARCLPPTFMIQIKKCAVQPSCASHYQFSNFGLINFEWATSRYAQIWYVLDK